MTAKLHFFGPATPARWSTWPASACSTKADQDPEGAALVDYLLGTEAQTYFADETFEYPVVAAAPGAGLRACAAGVDPGPVRRPRRPVLHWTTTVACCGGRPLTGAGPLVREPLPGRSRRCGAGPGCSGPRSLAVAVALIPLGYLLVRTAGAGPRGSVPSCSPRGSRELARRAASALAAVVTAGCLVLGVGSAFLVTRTDLPGRRVFGVLAALPLAVPHYVAAFAWVSTRRRVRRVLGGASLVLTLVQLPLRLLPVAAALRGADPAQEEVARSLGRGPAGDRAAGHAAADPAGGRRRRAAGRALRAVRLRRGVAAAARHVHPGHLHLLPGQLRPHPARRAVLRARRGDRR